VDILLDRKLLARGFKSTTGGWKTSQAKWEKQCTATITKGRHTVKLLCPGPCIPHICALRFETPAAFPEGWKLARRAPGSASAKAAGQQRSGTLANREGFLGFYPYNPPDSYDYAQPYDRVPLPNPRAHRVLEYVLFGDRYDVKAEVSGPAGPAAGAGDAARNELLQAASTAADEATPWVAKLSVKLGPKAVLSDTLPLSPARLKRMLAHATRLVDDFRSMPGQPRDLLAAERAEAAALLAELERLLAQPDAKGKWERFYALYVAAFKLANRIALSNPLLDFDRLVFAKRLTYNTSHIYTTYYDGAGRYKPGSGIFVLSPARPDGKLTCLTSALKTDGIYRDPDVHWDGDHVLFAYKADRPTGTHIYEVRADGSGLRQFTHGPYDDVDPCYLPDGRIAFISTRTERVTLCHNAFTVSNLFTMNPDGSNIR